MCDHKNVETLPRERGATFQKGTPQEHTGLTDRVCKDCGQYLEKDSGEMETPYSAMINALKSRAKLIEVRLTAVSYDMSLLYEIIEGEDLPETITEQIDDLNGSINAGLQEIDGLRNLIRTDGLK